MTDNERYLGNPLIFGRNKNLRFNSLVSKVRNRIKSWKIPLLLQDGRNTLAKSITTALSVYNVSVLHLPRRTSEILDKLYRDFWWEYGEEKKNIQTINQSDICKPMGEAGLGTRESQKNNMALLAKTCWRCLVQDDLLCSKILKTGYQPNKSLWEATSKRGMERIL